MSYYPCCLPLRLAMAATSLFVGISLESGLNPNTTNVIIPWHSINPCQGTFAICGLCMSRIRQACARCECVKMISTMPKRANMQDTERMAARKIKPKAAQAKDSFTEHKCRECAHHYDEHSPALDGHMILCRCPFKQQGGKYCIFLKDTACERFKPM